MVASQRLRDPVVVLSVRRALSATGAGALVGLLVAVRGAPELSPIVAWTCATVIVLTWVWRLIWPQDHAGTKRLAEAESRSRTTDTAILIAAVVSLGAVVLALVRSGGTQDAWATVAIVLSVVSVALSWCLVHTVFALKYARLYYLEQDGGIDFKQDRPPAYSDFAYLAFTVGMAFAASDTEPTEPAIRKVALGHALLSYVFSTGMLAVAVNLVTNLGQT
jgi:uncharacterized membrane protein